MKDKLVRKNFKFFKVNKDTVYFDNNSSALKPKSVVDAVNYYNTHMSTNAGRGVYKLAYNVTKQIEDTRSLVADFLNASKKEIVFVKNTTEAFNLVLYSYLLNTLKKDDEIVISLLEHHSLYLPLAKAAKKTGAKLVYVPLNKQHKVTSQNLKKVISDKTKVVGLTYVSNITGAKIPVKQLIKLAKQKGAITLVDAAQAVPHFKVDVKDLNCDFLAFSGYKLGAPTGSAVLYGKYDLLKQMPPFMYGGGMVTDSTSEIIEYKDAPHKFEAGTQPISQIIGLKKAIEFLTLKIGYNYIQNKDAQLYSYLNEELKKIKQVEIYNKDATIATVAFNIKGIHAHDIATAYDMYNICVRAGHNCVQPFIEYLNQASTVRASLYFYNTKKEIDIFIKATKKIIEYFNQF
jgi:cysteine desulfurase/selenocysteine lyase